ncbi:MAG: hypothetical protein ACXVP5_04195 [Tumebacillaceae bacterium]
MSTNGKSTGWRLVFPLIIFLGVTVGFVINIFTHTTNVVKVTVFLALIALLFLISTRWFTVRVLHRGEKTYKTLTIVGLVLFVPIWIYFIRDYIGLTAALVSSTLVLPFLLTKNRF